VRVIKPFRSPDVNVLDGRTHNGCNARPPNGHSRLRELREGKGPRGVIQEQPRRTVESRTRLSWKLREAKKVPVLILEPDYQGASRSGPYSSLILFLHAVALELYAFVPQLGDGLADVRDLPT